LEQGIVNSCQVSVTLAQNVAVMLVMRALVVACINNAYVAFLFRQLVLKSLNFFAVLQLFALGTLI
jgi:hypothetical protein